MANSHKSKIHETSMRFLLHRRGPLPDLSMPPPMQIPTPGAPAAPIPPPMQSTGNAMIRPTTSSSQVAFTGLSTSGLSASSMSTSKVCTVGFRCEIMYIEMHNDFADGNVHCGCYRSNMGQLNPNFNKSQTTR